MKRAFVAAAATAAAALAVAVHASPASSSSGIYGRVVLGPPCPVSLEVPRCPVKPLSAKVAVMRRGSNTRVATLHSGKNGRFRRALPPGSYRLEPRPTGSAYAAALSVRVPAGSFVQVTVRYHMRKR